MFYYYVAYGSPWGLRVGHDLGTQQLQQHCYVVSTGWFYVLDLIYYLSFHNFWNMLPSFQVMGISFRAEQRQFSVSLLKFVNWETWKQVLTNQPWLLGHFGASELGVSLTFSDNWKKKKKNTTLWCVQIIGIQIFFSINKSFIGTQSHSFVMAAFVQSWMALREALRPWKPKRVTVWPYSKRSAKLCLKLMSDLCFLS